MPNILVRDVEETVKRELQRRASRHGHSLQAEIRDILREASKNPAPAHGLGTELVRIFQGSGEEFPEIKELRGGRPEIPDFGRQASHRSRRGR